jgi:hypothetical protein
MNSALVPQRIKCSKRINKSPGYERVMLHFLYPQEGFHKLFLQTGLKCVALIQLLYKVIKQISE